MLVLSRHRNEGLYIGDDVHICVVDIRGDKVRLGIEAPQDIPVHRDEVYEAIKREGAKTLTVPAAITIDHATNPVANILRRFMEARTLVRVSIRSPMERGGVLVGDNARVLSYDRKKGIAEFVGDAANAVPIVVGFQDIVRIESMEDASDGQ